MSVTVDAAALRLGMYVHLDLGWWAHPFALSSFLITTPEQIATLHGLGLKKLRWSPEKSRLGDFATPGDGAAAEPAVPPASHSNNDHAGKQPSPSADSRADKPAPETAESHPAEPRPAPATAREGAANEDQADPAAPGPGLAQAAVPQPPLALQHAAQQLCERQYGEARQAWAEAERLLPQAPQQAREITEGLTRALLDKMMVDREMCVRVLSDAGSDSVSGHALNVTVISLLMGRVFGFSAPDMLDLGMGALLHDVGKIDLQERQRHEQAGQSASDLAAYRSHVARGLVQGQRMGLSEGALQVLAQHHEMADGSGWPAGLGLDRMATAARIVALVNRYDRLCNPPQAALGLTPHEALSLIFAQSRDKFDTTMLGAFIRMMGVYPPGSLVQLTDDRYAAVVSCNSTRPLKPRVLVCEAGVPVQEALLLNLDRQPDLGIRRSLKPGQLPAAARDYLSPRQRMVYFFEPVALATGDAQTALAA